jgi:hypothetical protein
MSASMSVNWYEATMTIPVGWTLALGNLTGATTWCVRCQAHTNHNTAWHAKHLKAG